MKKYLIIPISLIFASNLFCIDIPPLSPEFNIFGFLGASKTFTQTVLNIWIAIICKVIPYILTVLKAI